MKTEQRWKIGDCLKLLPEISDKSIDMILTDLPYGITRNRWDSVISLNLLWGQYNRIIKDSGLILLTAIQPFASFLVTSNPKMFRYELIWDHRQVRGFLNANKMPLRAHENVLVFYRSLPTYNIIKTKRDVPRERIIVSGDGSNNYGLYKSFEATIDPYERYPTSVIRIGGIVNNSNEKLNHPTQKPVALFEYLIRTYTNEGDWVHDSCLGSGTTLEACMNLNRNCIGFEIDPQWEQIYRKRLKLDNVKLDTFVSKHV